MTDAQRQSERRAERLDPRKEIRRAERDPWNRLNSIIEDASWVERVAKQCFPELPLIPNLRCGAWYVRSMHAGTRGCYFKSTDGHTSQWSFSLKRYNYDLIRLVKERDGCIIVDSTRRGKSMPDALSKTIPIWCAVLNEASLQVYGTPERSGFTELRTPTEVVSPSEQEQIRARTRCWVRDLCNSDLPVERFEKPLRPLFVTPARMDPEVVSTLGEARYSPMVLISASPMVSTPTLTPQPQGQHSRTSWGVKETDDLADTLSQNKSPSQRHFVYVQGSGDDEEMWAQGLTPELFWKGNNRSEILQQPGDVGHKIKTAVQTERLGLFGLDEQDDCPNKTSYYTNDDAIGETGIHIGRRSFDHEWQAQEIAKYARIIFMNAPSGSFDQDNGQERNKGTKVDRLDLPSGKKGLNRFREAISRVLPEIHTDLSNDPEQRPILICSSETDKGDLVGGLTVAILAYSFDEQRKLRDGQRGSSLTKGDVHRRLQWLLTSAPWATPSRHHLLRVNEVLLSESYRIKAKIEKP